MTPLVIVVNPATRRSGEVNFVTLMLLHAKATGEEDHVAEIRVSDEVPKHHVYLCKRTDLTIIPLSTKRPPDWEK